MSYVVTGASGLLGVAFKEVLGPAAQGWAHHNPGPDDRSLDVLDAAAVKAGLDAGPLEGVIHCAAIADVAECERDPDFAMQMNVEVPRRLSAECRTRGLPMVHISTDYIFAGDAGPYHEDSRPAPLQMYGRSKALAEEAVGDDQLIVRIPLLYRSPRMTTLGRDDFVRRARRDLENGVPLLVDDEQIRQPTLTYDVAATVVQLLERRATGVTHVAAQQGETQYALAVKMARSLGLPADRVARRDRQDTVPRPHSAWLAVDRLRRLSIEPPRPFDEVWRSGRIRG